MVPDLHDEGGGGVAIEPFRYLDTNGHINGNDSPQDIHQQLSATKLISHHTPSRNGNSFNRHHHSLPEQFLTNGAGYWPSLKAIPLASYYKLHRVPSLDSLTDMVKDQDGIQPVELPQSEPAHLEQPQDKVPPSPVHNKILEQVSRTPGRQPSPQPTHLNVPGPAQHRVLHEEGSGYVAPKFEGKELQMDQGMLKSCRKK